MRFASVLFFPEKPSVKEVNEHIEIIESLREVKIGVLKPQLESSSEKRFRSGVPICDIGMPGEVF